MHAFWLSLAVIFVAELGDKSQLMALAFATRYRTLPVLIGMIIVNHVLAELLKTFHRLQTAFLSAADSL